MDKPGRTRQSGVMERFEANLGARWCRFDRNGGGRVTFANDVARSTRSGAPPALTRIKATLNQSP